MKLCLVKPLKRTLAVILVTSPLSICAGIFIYLVGWDAFKPELIRILKAFVVVGLIGVMALLVMWGCKIWQDTLNENK